MPYIKIEQRARINSYLHELTEQIQFMEHDVLKRPGIVNYIVTRIVATTLRPDEGWSYHSASRALAVLRDAEAEMRRRLMDIVENSAIRRNGDILEYTTIYEPTKIIPKIEVDKDGHWDYS